MKTVIEGLEKGLKDIATALGGGSEIVPTPTAQDEGKVLTANDDGTASWENPDSGLPSTSGHNLNEVLIIGDTTTTPPTASWYALQEVLPNMDPNDYPSNGDVIAYNSSTHKAEWQTPQSGGGVPSVTSSDSGKVLTAYYDDKSGTGSAEWVTPSGGGGIGSTTFTVNGSNFVQHGSSYTVLFDSGDYQIDLSSVVSARIYYSGECSVPCSLIYEDKTGWLAQVTADDYTYISSTSGLTLKIFSIS